jgi:hypothetical protein
MPRATVSTEPIRVDLKSCPGGWVTLRRMSHGQMLHRQDIAMALQMQQDRRSKTASMEVKQMQTEVGLFELKTCIVDHNLEDESGRKLNFSAPVDAGQLDGRIGAEIATKIEEMHDWETELPNSNTSSEGSSSVKAEAQPVTKDLTPQTVG